MIFHIWFVSRRTWHSVEIYLTSLVASHQTVCLSIALLLILEINTEQVMWASQGNTVTLPLETGDFSFKVFHYFNF